MTKKTRRNIGIIEVYRLIKAAKLIFYHVMIFTKYLYFDLQITMYTLSRFWLKCCSSLLYNAEF